LLHKLLLFGAWFISSSRYLFIMPLYEFKRNRQYIDTGLKSTHILEASTSRKKTGEQPNPPVLQGLCKSALAIKVWYETCRKEV